MSEQLEIQLRDAAKVGSVEEARDLIGKKVNVDCLDSHGRTPLHWGAMGGHTPFLEVLLEAGANATIADKYGFTALHFGARQGNCDTCQEIPTFPHLLVQLLVKFGAPMEAKDERGMTPLFTAAQFNHAEAVKTLLDLGADPKTTNRGGKTPLDVTESVVCKELLSKAVGATLPAAATKKPDITSESDGCC